MAADYALSFRRLFGDADGDGSVSSADSFQFRRRFGLTLA
jgi:hypothetical protein